MSPAGRKWMMMAAVLIAVAIITVPAYMTFTPHGPHVAIASEKKVAGSSGASLTHVYKVNGTGATYPGMSSSETLYFTGNNANTSAILFDQAVKFNSASAASRAYWNLTERALGSPLQHTNATYGGFHYSYLYNNATAHSSKNTWLAWGVDGSYMFSLEGQRFQITNSSLNGVVKDQVTAMLS